MSSTTEDPRDLVYELFDDDEVFYEFLDSCELMGIDWDDEETREKTLENIDELYELARMFLLGFTSKIIDLVDTIS